MVIFLLVVAIGTALYAFGLNLKLDEVTKQHAAVINSVKSRVDDLENELSNKH